MLAPLLMASTCESEDDEQILCTTEFVSGLHVDVLDAVTHEPLTEGVQVKAVDGTYQEILYLNVGLETTFKGAGERIGLYTITVTKEGYETYTSSPIGVTANVCHVNPQQLTVNLQPE